MKRTGLLRRLSKITPFHLRKSLYFGLIQSAIDYWGSTTVSNIDKVYKLQKRAMRVVLGVAFDCPSHFIFDAMNVLSVRQRIVYFTCVLVFKCLEGNAPSYLTNNFYAMNQVHDYQTRAAANQVLQTPIFRSGNGQRSFNMRGVRLWNTLPTHIKNSTSLPIFKRLLITFIKTNVDK